MLQNVYSKARIKIVLGYSNTLKREMNNIDYLVTVALVKKCIGQHANRVCR